MEKIRVGVIGIGLAWERLHFPAFQELNNEYQIVALCDVDLMKAEKWGLRLGLDLQKDIFTDCQAMIERDDIQVVDIMVPIAKNHLVAEMVARSGKAVILEKPMGATIDQAIGTCELPSKYGIKLMVAENFRYSEEFGILYNLINTKKIGEVVFFINHSTSCFPCAMTKNTFSATEWRQHPAYPGGDILDAAIHDLAGLRHLFGGIQYLQAFGVPQRDDFSPYAVVTVNMHFLNGIIGEYSYYSAGREVQKPGIGLRIFGTQGMIYLEDPECGIINVFYNNGQHEMIEYRPMRGYYNELLNFYHAFNGREQIAVTPEVEIGDVRTVYAILQSINEQDVVKVDKKSQYAMR